MVLEKLFKYVGKGIKNVVEPKDEPHCFRLHNNRIFYVREDLMRRATNVSQTVSVHSLLAAAFSVLSFSCAAAVSMLFSSCAGQQRQPYLQVRRDHLVSLGQQIGKLTHSGKFNLTVGALDLLAAHAKYKVSGRRRWQETCPCFAEPPTGAPLLTLLCAHKNRQPYDDNLHGLISSESQTYVFFPLRAADFATTTMHSM